MPEAVEEVAVDVTLTAKDARRFGAQYLATRPATVTGVAVIVPFALVLPWLFPTGSGVSLVLVVTLAASGLATLLLLGARPLLWADVIPWGTPARVRFTEDGLVAEAGGARRHVPWARVQGARETRGYFALVQHPGAVHVVPKHAFRDVLHLARARRVLEARLGDRARLRA